MTERRKRQDPARWVIREIEVDLASLPQVVDVSRSRVQAFLFMLLGASWLVGALGLPSRMPLQGSMLTAIAWAGARLGVVFLIAGLRLTRPRQATLHSDGVAFEGTRVKARFMPYASYRGVAYAEVLIGRGRRTSQNVPSHVQIIELLHDDPALTVPLFVRRSDHIPRQRWEDYARRLGLPALEVDLASPNGLSARPHDALDKPLVERLRDGEAEPFFDGGERSPQGLRVDEGARDTATITIAAPRTPDWFSGLRLIPIVFLYLAARLVDLVPFVLGVTVPAAVILLAFLVYRDRASRRALTLDAGGIIVTDDLSSEPDSQGSIALGEIESIAVRRHRGNLGDELVIAGDDRRLRVGLGLSRSALVWLKRYLVAGMAKV